MGSPYTPDPTNSPAFITLPDPGDPVASAVAGQAWKDVADLQAKAVRGTVAGETGTINGDVDVASTGRVITFAGSQMLFGFGTVETHGNHPTFGSADFSGTLSVGGSGVLDLNGNGILRKSVALTGAGRIKDRISELAGTGDTAASSATFDVFAYLGLTGARVLQLINTGAEVGDHVLVTLVPLGTNVNAVTVQDGGGSPIAVLNAPSVGPTSWAEFSFFATGGWRVTKYGP